LDVSPEGVAAGSLVIGLYGSETGSSVPMTSGGLLVSTFWTVSISSPVVASY
jgi:hypothetical protein